jgi:cell wall assembly regulator SMI1
VTPLSHGERTQEYSGLLAKLDGWLAAHRHNYLRALRPGASAAELDALQAAVGMPLPAGVRTFLAWHNGQGEDYPGKFEENWRLLGTTEIAETRQQLLADEETKPHWQPAWIPLLDDDGGDFLFIDAAQPEAPVRSYYLGKSEQEVVAPSLASWLEEFVKAVEKGAYTEDPERGSFVRVTHSKPA